MRNPDCEVHEWLIADGRCSCGPDQKLLQEVIEETRKKAVTLLQEKIDSMTAVEQHVHNLAEYIVTEDFLKKFRELFLDDTYRSHT